MNHTVPDSRPTSWHALAACRAEGIRPDEMFPDNHEPGITHAKRICAPCPVRLACLVDALRNRETQHGIRGGLEPSERRAVAKRLTTEQLSNPDAVGDAARQVVRPVVAAVQKATQPVTAVSTLRNLWEERTYPLPNGHLGWRGKLSPNFQGKQYTPKRIAFVLDRGREPVGIVRRTCEVAECVHPRCLADKQERQQRAEEVLNTASEPSKPGLARCGTRSAYQRHVRNKEPIDEACRVANTLGSLQYQQTGTSKSAEVPVEDTTPRNKGGRPPAPCGTRSAYQRHVKKKEPIDDACRKANTDADNRLRRTGTTKVAA